MSRYIIIHNILNFLNVSSFQISNHALAMMIKYTNNRTLVGCDCDPIYIHVNVHSHFFFFT